MAKIIDVNNRELINFAKKLDKIHRSKLPNAVRNTLNSVAFHTKKKTLQEEASKTFTRRNSSFFKRFSSVEMAKGFNINRMQSKAGMTAASRTGKPEQAGLDQTQQQQGGTIKGRTFIPLDTARVSNNNKKNVRRKNRIKNLKIVLNTKDATGQSPKKRFVSSAVVAIKKFGSGAIIQHKRQDGKQFLYRVERGGKNIKTREFSIKVTPLYSVKKGRTIRVSAKPFTMRAGLKAQKLANKFFEQHAKRQLSKIRK